VGHFCPLGSGSGFTDRGESGSNPDPKHWFFLYYITCHLPAGVLRISHTTMGQRGCYLLALQDWRENTLALSYSDGRLPILKFFTHQKITFLHSVIEIFFSFFYTNMQLYFLVVFVFPKNIKPKKSSKQWMHTFKRSVNWSCLAYLRPAGWRKWNVWQYNYQSCRPSQWWWTFSLAGKVPYIVCPPMGSI
jgi:hypothetical protein